MSTLKLITVSKAGIQRFNPITGQVEGTVPVGTKAVFDKTASTGAPYDLIVITNRVNNFNQVDYWKLPFGANPEDYFFVVDIQRNPDGSFPETVKALLPKWLYTNGVIDKLGPGLIDPEWWRKNRWWIWAIAGLTAIILLDDGKK